tara:strand:+ start:580 stop:852 length:273 start_codon:yes stop_codon:yes gene_type:complete
MVKIGKYDYKKSTNPKKKLMVVVNNKTIHFGSRDMEQFKDKTGIWKNKDHNDDKRRKLYLTRSSGIKRKDGTLTKNDPTSANFHSRSVLW